MKVLLYASTLLFIGSCATLSHKEKIQTLRDNVDIYKPSILKTYANTITASELKEHLYIFSSDAYQGRQVGTSGQKKLLNILKTITLKKK